MLHEEVDSVENYVGAGGIFISLLARIFAVARVARPISWCILVVVGIVLRIRFILALLAPLIGRVSLHRVMAMIAVTEEVAR